MYAWVSAALRQHILENFAIDEDDLDDTVSETMVEVSAADSRSEPDEAPQRLVDKLFDASQLTPGFLIKALHQSEVTLFDSLASPSFVGSGRF